MEMALGRFVRRQGNPRRDEIGDLAAAMDNLAEFLGRTREDLDRGAATLTQGSVELLVSADGILAGMDRLSGQDPAGNAPDPLPGRGEASGGLRAVERDVEQLDANLAALGTQAGGFASAMNAPGDSREAPDPFMDPMTKAKSEAEIFSLVIAQARQGAKEVRQHVADLREARLAVLENATQARDAARDLARQSDAMRKAIGRYSV
jgi:methyl-accepting chemotaxis protein